MEAVDEALPPGPVRAVKPRAGGIDVTLAGGTCRVAFLADGIVRIRVLRAGQSEADVSWAVVDSDRPAAAVRCEDRDEAVSVCTDALSVSIRRADGAITVTSPTGPALLDAACVAWEGDVVRLSWSQPAERNVYGCGEKSGPLERRGRTMRMWNTNSYAYGEDTDPLYLNIPFCLAMDGGRAHGLFWDNTFEQRWQLGGPGEPGATVEADGGAVDLYVIAGPAPGDVLRRFSDLTGRMTLPPIWAVGYQQSRYAYYPEAQFREIAAEFRRRRIPCDVMYLDVLYMDRYMSFTWDRNRFPDPERMLAELRADGIQTVVILDPGIKVEEGYAPYDQLIREGFYVRNPDGTPFVGPEWPGDCIFPDFTDARCRAWWSGICADLLSGGVAGLWNDMNEPEVMDAPGKTMPPHVLFSGDGNAPGDHRRYHNVYGMLMGRATREGLERARPGERPFVLARAGYAGLQRYAATWTGDNVSSWEHLRMCIPMTLNIGLSGIGFCGADVGGFSGEASAELFGRWLQANALFPFCRVHSAKTDSDTPMAEGLYPQEPWVYGEEWEAINRSYIELRYRFLPYLYTVMEEMTRTGAPMVRPLFYEYPDDPRCRNRDDQYLVGRDILCAPVVHEGADSRTVYLPEGSWYDFWTNALIPGGREITADAPLHRLPLYVRAGAAIPTQGVVQHTGECEAEPIEWLVYLDGGATGDLYEDDGHTMEYETGRRLRTRLHVSADGSWSAETTGSYDSPRPPARVRIIRQV